MERPTIVIISDEPGFSSAITERWMSERNVPSFTMISGSHLEQLQHESFDVAVVGRIHGESVEHVLDCLRPPHKPAVLVSSLNGQTPLRRNLITVAETEGWQSMVVVLTQELLNNARTRAELTRMREINSELEQQAALGRYVLEVRHNLNNALTSILGNSDLILLESGDIAPALRAQVETIRNMGMRMNEIMHRFTSLQKEMKLMEEASQNHRANAMVAK